MLSDQQLDDLLRRVQSVPAREIVGVLDEVVPYLIAEIRLSREALIQQGYSFLGGIHDQHQQGGGDLPVGPANDPRQLPEGSEHPQDPRHEPANPEEEDPASAAQPRAGKGKRGGSTRRPKPGRDRSIGTPYEGLLDGRGGSEPLGGESGEQVRDGGPLAIEPSPRLTDIPGQMVFKEVSE